MAQVNDRVERAVNTDHLFTQLPKWTAAQSLHSQKVTMWKCIRALPCHSSVVFLFIKTKYSQYDFF